MNAFRLYALPPLFAMIQALSSALAVTGQDMMREASQRYAPPSHVYEEQALLTTNRQGKLTVRTLRSYTLRDDRGIRFLKIIETPADAKGTAVYTWQDHEGRDHGRVAASSPLFGSTFAIVDFSPEDTASFRYEKEGDHLLERVPHHVLRATPADDSVSRRTGYHERRFYLRKDNLFISRIEYRDKTGRLVRRQTFRDPGPDDAGVWRPRMVLMENLQEGERTLLKVEKRVHSPDYVPATLFAGLRSEP